MSETLLMWAFAAALFGAAVCLFTLARLVRLLSLMWATRELRPGAVELFGRLVLRGAPLPDSPDAAVVYQHRQALVLGGEDPDIELAFDKDIRAAKCELHTSLGRIALDLQRSLSDIASPRTQTRMLAETELQSGPNSQLVARAITAPNFSDKQIISYKLTETTLLDGDPLLILGEAAALPVPRAEDAGPWWQLSGPSGNPMVIRAGTPVSLIGGDLVWLTALGILGGISLYYGYRLLHVVQTYQVM